MAKQKLTKGGLMKINMIKLVVYSFIVMNLSILRFAAGGWIGDTPETAVHPNYGNYGKDYPNYGNEVYGGGGMYGGGGGGAYWNGGYNVYPYPPEGSQPGMGDDSSELYNSYLQKNGQGY